MKIETWIRSTLLRVGPVWLTTLITLLCIVLALGLTEVFISLDQGWDHGIDPTQITLPIIIPLLVIPPGVYITLRLLEKLIVSEAANEHLVSQLQTALDDIDNLSGLLPICSACKDIKDTGGNWHSIEDYVSDHSEADFTHGLCPKCAVELYPADVLNNQ